MALLNSPFASPGVVMAVCSAIISPLFAFLGVEGLAVVLDLWNSLGLSEGGGFVAGMVLTTIGPILLLQVLMSLLVPVGAVLLVGVCHAGILKKHRLPYRIGSDRATFATFAVVSAAVLLLFHLTTTGDFSCHTNACEKLNWKGASPLIAFLSVQTTLAALAASIYGRSFSRLRLKEPSNP